jgi:hypothetical protein
MARIGDMCPKNGVQPTTTSGLSLEPISGDGSQFQKVKNQSREVEEE